MIIRRRKEEEGMKPAVVTGIDKTGKYYWVKCEGRDEMQINSFSNGMVTFETSAYVDLFELVDGVVGCFTHGSNFSREFAKVCNNKQPITHVRIIHNGLNMVFDVKAVDKDKIIEEYMRLTR